MSKSSSQKFIARNRAPRVQIEYDIELYGAEKKIQLPFVIGVMADLSGNAADPLAPVVDRSFLEIDVDNFNDRLKSMKPRVEFQVPNDLTGEGNLSIDITFENMDDFSPGAVASKVEGLKQLLKTRTQLSNLLTYMDGKGGAEELIAKALNESALLQSLASASKPAAEINRTDETGGLGETRELTMAETENQATGATLAVPTKTSETDDFTTLLQQAFKPKSERAKEAFEDAVKTLAEQALTKTDLISDDAVKSIEAIIAEIDKRLSDQVNRIMHHPDFQKLEGSWRGMQYLANNTETDEMLKIRFMSLTKRELSKIIRRYKGSVWDQSPLFKKIYEDVYGQFGGEPYGCLIGDYEFGNGPEDIDILYGVAQIAAAAHSPFIAAASPSIMQMGSWQEIANPRDLSKVFLTPDYAAWRSLRESEESIYLALAMPRFLARRPYGDDAEPVEEFAFQEDCDAGNADSFVWCNSAYAMGVNITRAFKLYGWCVRIRGMESGGMVEGLPTHGFPTDDGGVDMRSPTEVSISDRWEAELSRNGFMPLLHGKTATLQHL